MTVFKLWVVGLLSLTFLAVAQADAKASGCTSDLSIEACPGSGTGEIDVSGEQLSTSVAPEDPPAARVVVTCGAGAAASLGALGLSDPAYVANCQEQQLVCGVAKIKPGETQSPVIRLEQQGDGSWAYGGGDCVVTEPPKVTAALVREQASRLIPAAAIGLAPHGTTLVNIETVMWADAPHTRSLPPVTILGKRVVISLVLDHVAWVFGDGVADGDAPAGKAYDAQSDPCKTTQCAHYYGHVYTRTGKITVTATASWHASFTVNGGASIDIPGTIAGPQAREQLVVKQARGVLVPNPDGN